MPSSHLESETAVLPPSGSETDLSVDLGPASLWGILMGLGVTAPFVLLFAAMWGRPALAAGNTLIFDPIWRFFAYFLLGIILHEAIHGLTWTIAGRVPWKSMKFGVVWQALTPYCHSTVPLKPSAYRLGAAMPGLLLGVMPMLIGLTTGLGWLLVWGAVMTISAGGDMFILWLIRHVTAAQWVLDHPSRAGCIVTDACPLSA